MNWFERWRARRKLRAQFSHYVASEVIDELVSRPKPDRPTPEPTQLCFILLQVRDDPEKDRDHRAKSVARLVTELGRNIRLVYGTVDGLLGDYGGEQRLVYGPLLPDFQRYVTALTALEFGRSAEISAT